MYSRSWSMYQRGLITEQQFVSYCYNSMLLERMIATEKETGLKFNSKPSGKNLFQ